MLENLSFDTGLTKRSNQRNWSAEYSSNNSSDVLPILLWHCECFLLNYSNLGKYIGIEHDRFLWYQRLRKLIRIIKVYKQDEKETLNYIAQGMGNYRNRMMFIVHPTQQISSCISAIYHKRCSVSFWLLLLIEDFQNKFTFQPISHLQQKKANLLPKYLYP